MSHVPALVASLLIAAAACMGQTKSAPTHTAPQPPKTSAMQAMKSDAQIEATIRAKFARSKINVEKFTVHVQGGVATIEGKTNVIQHKGTATRLAKTGGAVAVNNHIQISDAAKQKAADNLDSGRRRAQVTRGDPRSDTDSARAAH
jgi:osmotically-inducible protein OsmY